MEPEVGLEMSTNQTVVVIGGGIWGFSTAFHLAKLGVQNVIVIEQNALPAMETTPRAAGLVGQIRTSAVMCGAIQYALDLFTNFEEQTGINPGLQRTGSLFVALNDERMEAYKGQIEKAKANGVDAGFVTHAEMQRLSPDLNVASVVGGYYVQGDGYLDPRQCALAFAAASRDLGVTVKYSTRVTGISVENGKVCGVETTDGHIGADQVIVTAGPWTAKLGQMAGYQLPMQTIRHQRVVTVPIDGIPNRHPVLRVTDMSCYIRPEHGGYLYGYFEPNPTPIELDDQHPDFRTDDLPDAIDIMNEAQQRLSDIFPILGKVAVAERIQGVTTFAPDGQYVIGPVPGVDGLHLAAGCAALGIAGSAAVGKWLAETVVTGIVPDALQMFNHQRFGAASSQPGWVHDASLSFYGNYYALTPGTPNR